MARALRPTPKGRVDARKAGGRGRSGAAVGPRAVDAEAPPARRAAPKSSSGGSLVVVESPAKAKTIKKYLGRGFEVRASVGHVKDLPKSKIGVDVDRGFRPEYETINGFLFKVSGHIPELNEEIRYDKLQFTVTKKTQRRIRQVKVLKLARPEGIQGQENVPLPEA